jgi:hypothetical protein
MLAARKRSVEDPCAAYDSLLDIWTRSRAVIGGERYVKAVDTLPSSSNMLLPFSPSMTLEQYNFYKGEAELPGIVSQFAKMIVGGLLRKEPQITFTDQVPEEAQDWLRNAVAMDGNSLVSFLDEALYEEVQTSRAWVYVDYPIVDPTAASNMTQQEWQDVKPYPVIWKAESVINWQTAISNGKHQLSRLVLRGTTEKYDEENIHPRLIDTIWVHELSPEGNYQIRRFEASEVQQKAANGATPTPSGNPGFHVVETIEPKSFGLSLKFIPAWPLNGSIQASEPMITPLVDKEVALYNKMSRRNHLLYGAATYTPWVSSDMIQEDFEDIVSGGLGSWIKLRAGDAIGVLATPTDALKDSDRAIAAAIDEMARMGIRMLTPESAQSGVALEIRNAAQTAQLGTLNVKISATISDVLAHLTNRRYNLQLTRADIQFHLSADFSPVPLGADWLRLATEWYEKGLIPRSTWLALIKANDLIEPDYNDEEATKEINDDELIMPKGDPSDSADPKKLNPKKYEE